MILLIAGQVTSHPIFFYVVSVGGHIQYKGQPSHPLIRVYIALKCYACTVTKMFIVYLDPSGEDIVAWLANRFRIDALGKYIILKHNLKSNSRVALRNLVLVSNTVVI